MTDQAFALRAQLLHAQMSQALVPQKNQNFVHQNHQSIHNTLSSFPNLPPNATDHINTSKNSQPKASKKRRESKTCYNSDLKVPALNYFCNSKGRNMASLCQDLKQTDMYDNLKEFISRDEVFLKEVHVEMKHGYVEHRSRAIRQLNQLIPSQVVLSGISLPDANIHCLSLNNPQVTSYAVIDLNVCQLHWKYSQDIWRSKKCTGSTHLNAKSAELMGWKKTLDGSFQHLSCHFPKENARHYSQQLSCSSRRSTVGRMLKGEEKRVYDVHR